MGKIFLKSLHAHHTRILMIDNREISKIPIDAYTLPVHVPVEYFWGNFITSMIENKNPRRSNLNYNVSCCVETFFRYI